MQITGLRAFSSERSREADDDDFPSDAAVLPPSSTSSSFIGDARFPSSASASSDEAARAKFEAEMALRRYKRKKRPDRTPFNPLPETYDDDEEADLPHEVLMDRAEYEELTEEEQQRVRTHQGLLRLRRNEQKLVRLLQMQKPDRVDLLMLLNEVEQLQGMERKMHERYIGPKVGLEQLQDDLDLAFGWKGLEEDDFPEIVGDSQAVELTRERRSEEESESEEKMEEDEAEEEEQKKLAGGTSSALITTEAVWQAEYKLRTKQIAQNKRRALESGEPSDAIEQENPTRVRLLEAHKRWKQVEEKKRRQSEPELSEPLLADEEETQRLEELKEKFPDGYDENHQDDEFFEAEAAQDLEAEVDLMTSDTDVGTRETELASEEKAEADRLVEEGRKDPSVQALLGGADEMQRVLSKGKLSEEDVRRLQELEQKEEQELAVLEEHSTLWRAKQEVVAQWRAAMASAGHKLDDAEVSAFLNAVSDEEEEQLREFDDVSQEAEMDKELVIKRAQQQVRKQKKWLSELREVFGEETVKQLVRDGRIQLKTHAALGQVLRENVQADLAESLAEVSELQKEMESFDAEVAQLFGISVEDVQKLSESPTAEVAIPSLEERQRLHAEQMPAQAQKQAEEFSALLSSLTQRDMLAEADAAEAEDDMVAARKLRLMHARRMEWEQSDEDDSSRASMSRQDLQRLGDVLAEGNREGDVDASSYAIQRTQFGRVSAEEVKLNRELIARGDGNDERFVDEDVHDPANRSSFVQAITLPPEQLRIRDESKVDDAIPGRKQRAARSATEHVEALVAANNAAALEYSQMSVEKKMEISNADEKAHREDNDDFDDYVLSQLPLKLHKKAVRMWKRLSEADRNAAILQGRENRDRLRAWMGERLLTYSEDEHQPDVLTQYYIDEKDPKIYNAIEGAFWTVGRWGLDERTDEQREADVNRRIVPRFRPHVADTQQLLDQVEAELFGVRADELTEKDIDDDADLTEEDKRVYKERLRLAKRQQPNTQLEAGDGEVEDAVMVDGVDGRDRLKAAGEEGVDVGEEGEAMVEAEKAGDELLAEEGRVEEDTLRASDADDDRERDQYDVFSEEEEDPDAEDERRKGRRNRDEDAAADDDGEGMDQEDEERMPPTEPGSESELQQRKRREMDARRIKFQDFDPIPTGDQRAFDDRYFHFDEEVTTHTFHTRPPYSLARPTTGCILALILLCRCGGGCVRCVGLVDAAASGPHRHVQVSLPASRERTDGVQLLHQRRGEGAERAERGHPPSPLPAAQVQPVRVDSVRAGHEVPHEPRAHAGHPVHGGGRAARHHARHAGPHGRGGRAHGAQRAHHERDEDLHLHAEVPPPHGQSRTQRGDDPPVRQGGAEHRQRGAHAALPPPPGSAARRRRALRQRERPAGRAGGGEGRGGALPLTPAAPGQEGGGGVPQEGSRRHAHAPALHAQGRPRRRLPASQGHRRGEAAAARQLPPGADGCDGEVKGPLQPGGEGRYRLPATAHTRRVHGGQEEGEERQVALRQRRVPPRKEHTAVKQTTPHHTTQRVHLQIIQHLLPLSFVFFLLDLLDLWPARCASPLRSPHRLDTLPLSGVAAARSGLVLRTARPAAHAALPAPHHQHDHTAAQQHQHHAAHQPHH